MNKKNIIRQILISCGISVMISTTTSIVQNQLFIKKCNKAFEEINDDIEEIQSDINQLKQNNEKQLADIKELREGYESLNARLEVLENLEDKVFNSNLEELKKYTEVTVEMEETIKKAYSLNKEDSSKGGDFIIALAILDCEIYGENKKYVISTLNRTDEYEVLCGINNPDILILGTNINGEYVYTSLANNNLIINNIDIDVEKYFSYIERIPNEEPVVSYEEIKILEEELNNSNKLTRK